MRTSHTQLPTFNELQSILAAEAARPIPRGNEGLHFADFTTIINLLSAFNLPTRFFTEHFEFADFEDESLFSETVKMFNDLIVATLSAEGGVEKHKLFNELYDYLSEEDEPEHADIIFVFGSKQTYRIEKAVDLYKQGYAPKILVSGKAPFYEKDTATAAEAEMFAEYAIQHGVPEDALILEQESITVPDNVKRSLNLLENIHVPHETIILVNSPFSHRRGWAHFSKMSSLGTRLLRANVDKVSDTFSRDGWYKNETGAKVVIKEFFGLRVSELINTS